MFALFQKGRRAAQTLFSLPTHVTDQPHTTWRNRYNRKDHIVLKLALSNHTVAHSGAELALSIGRGIV
jgi:hypothetical protein